MAGMSADNTSRKLPSISSKQVDKLSEALSDISISDHNQPFSENQEQHCEQNSFNGFITDDEFTFPRCEYKVRFKGTSAFKMRDSEYWGTYYRPINCRYDQLNRMCTKYSARTPYNYPDLDNKDNAERVKSPWEIADYKKIFSIDSLPHKTKKNTRAGLYDQLLQYRKYICRKIDKQFKKLTEGIEERNIRILVHYQNNYPCILVQVKEVKDICSSEVERDSLYKLVLAYFTGITNNIAYEKSVPIELVYRASFGHNIPSVVEAVESFRINTGIVPKIYAKVLAEGLKSLNDDFLLPLFSKDESFKLNSNVCHEHNSDTDKYCERHKYKRNRGPKAVDNWNQDDNLIDILCKRGNLDLCSRGPTVSKEITRKKEYIDLLTDYVQKELSQIETQPDLAQPLRKILEKLDYSGEYVTLNNYTIYLTAQYSFRDKKHPSINSDDKFWVIIGDISLVFEKLSIYKLLVKQINERNIVGLYAILERANTEFIRKSSFQDSKDDYGSDSDCEGICWIPPKHNHIYIPYDIYLMSGESIRCYSKKITVSTGLRAIELAQILSVYITDTENVPPKFNYYEMFNAIKKVRQIAGSVNCFLKRLTSETKKISYLNLTHCACKGSGPLVFEIFKKQEITDEVKVIVFDCTSATSLIIRDALKKFIKVVPVLLLVSSGLKNEQIGADMNPYGTLRIITKNKDDLNEYYLGLRCALGEMDKLPKESHNIRKAYKAAGAALNSAAIYDRIDCKIENSPEVDFKTRYYKERYKKIIDLFDEYVMQNAEIIDFRISSKDEEEET